MNNKFNSGDTVKYTSPYDGRTANGVVKTVDFAMFNHSSGYFIEWSNGSSSWITDSNLSLLTSVSLSVQATKELKVALETEIRQLIERFNEKTSLQVHDINLVCRTTIGGTYLYEVQVKVDF